MVNSTHWGRVTHICTIKLTIISSDNGLSTGRRQAIIWTNAGILLIGNLGTNFSDILSEIKTFSFKKIRLETSSAKWRPFCLVLNELNFAGCHEDVWVVMGTALVFFLFFYIGILGSVLQSRYKITMRGKYLKTTFTLFVYVAHLAMLVSLHI